MDQVAVFLFVEEFADGFRDARADFVDALQIFARCGHEGFHRAEFFGEKLGGAFADETDAEAIEDAGEAGAL